VYSLESLQQLLIEKQKKPQTPLMLEIIEAIEGEIKVKQGKFHEA